MYLFYVFATMLLTTNNLWGALVLLYAYFSQGLRCNHNLCKICCRVKCRTELVECTGKECVIQYQFANSPAQWAAVKLAAFVVALVIPRPIPLLPSIDGLPSCLPDPCTLPCRPTLLALFVLLHRPTHLASLLDILPYIAPWSWSTLSSLMDLLSYLAFLIDLYSPINSLSQALFPTLSPGLPS